MRRPRTGPFSCYENNRAMPPPALPRALAPLVASPRGAAVGAVVSATIAITWASYGTTLLLVVALAFALPALWHGNGRRAAVAMIAAGALPLLLALALCGGYELDKSSSPDPRVYATMNHETGFAAMLLGLGIGLPSLLASALLATLASRAGRWITTPRLDAADDALVGAAAVATLAGAGSVALLRWASISLEPTRLVLPAFALPLLLVVIAREAVRGPALARLYAGEIAGIAIAAREGEDPAATPIVDPRGAAIDHVVVAREPSAEPPYRGVDGRAVIAAAPGTIEVARRAGTARLGAAIALLVVDAGTIVWIAGYLRRGLH